MKIFLSVLLATSSNAFLSHQISTSQPTILFSQSKLAPPTASHNQPQPAKQSESSNSDHVLSIYIGWSDIFVRSNSNDTMLSTYMVG